MLSICLSKSFGSKMYDNDIFGHIPWLVLVKEISWFSDHVGSCVTLTTFIWKVTDSNVKRDKPKPERFLWIFSVPPGSCRQLP
jgi:hypothetical protein